MVTQGRRKDPQDRTTQVGEEPKVCDVMPDGSLYAGLSPDTRKAMYTTLRYSGRPYTWKKAIAFAARLAAHGHRDWRVPTKGELNALYNNRAAIGGFGSSSGSFPAGWYWSALRDSNDDPWAQRFSDGDQNNLQQERRLVSAVCPGMNKGAAIRGYRKISRCHAPVSLPPVNVSPVTAVRAIHSYLLPMIPAPCRKGRRFCSAGSCGGGAPGGLTATLSAAVSWISLTK